MSYIPGDHYFICDICGLKKRRSEGRMRWDNLFVCSADYEERNQQEELRAVFDKTRVDIARPAGEDSFLSINEVTQESL